MEWRLDLMLKHPRLFTIAETPSHSFGYPNCERGWRDILVRVCHRIETALHDRDAFEFVKIAPKMGILRINWEVESLEETHDGIAHAVDLAVARSACTCEICGAAGRLYDNKGWFETRCAEHAAGAPVAPRYGRENLRRLRRRRGQAGMYLASYDRETDTLTEVLPPSQRREK